MVGSDDDWADETNKLLEELHRALGRIETTACEIRRSMAEARGRYEEMIRLRDQLKIFAEMDPSGLSPVARHQQFPRSN